MSTNHNSLCQDGFFGSIHIKGKQVLDQNRNLKNVKTLQVKKDAQVKKDLCVLGDVFVKGEIIY